MLGTQRNIIKEITHSYSKDFFCNILAVTTLSPLIYILYKYILGGWEENTYVNMFILLILMAGFLETLFNITFDKITGQKETLQFQDKVILHIHRKNYLETVQNDYIYEDVASITKKYKHFICLERLEISFKSRLNPLIIESSDYDTIDYKWIETKLGEYLTKTRSE